MADRQSSTATDDNLLMVYLNRRLIKVLDESVWLYQLADKFPLPEGSGTQMTFNGWRRIGAPSSTLAEMSANSAVVLSSRKINVTINSYGRSVKVSDLLEKTSIAPPVQGAIERLMQSAALAQDNVVQLAILQNNLDRVGKDTNAKTKMLSAWTGALQSSFCANTGTSGNTLQFGLPVVFAASSTRLSVSTVATISSRFGAIAIRKAVTRLMKFDAQPFADGNYVGIVHPNAMSTALGNNDTKQWYLNYESGPAESMFKGKVTLPIHGARFIISTNIPRYASSTVSVNITPILSDGCVGVVELGDSVQMIVKRPGDQNTNDPYSLFSTIAYKFRGVGAVLNPSAGCVLISQEKV